MFNSLEIARIMSYIITILLIVSCITSLVISVLLWFRSERLERRLKLLQVRTDSLNYSIPELALSKRDFRKIAIFAPDSLRETVACLPLLMAIKEHVPRVRLSVFNPNKLWGIWHNWGLIDMLEPESVNLAIYVSRQLGPEQLKAFLSVPTDIRVILLWNELIGKLDRINEELILIPTPADEVYIESIERLSVSLVGKKWSGKLPEKFELVIRELAGEALSGLKLKTESYIVVAPSSKSEFRALPQKAIVRLLWDLNKIGIPIILLGTADDKERLPLEPMDNVLDLRGETSLSVAFALTVFSRMIICADNLYRQLGTVFRIPTVTVGYLHREAKPLLPPKRDEIIFITPYIIQGFRGERMLVLEDMLISALVERSTEMLKRIL